MRESTDGVVRVILRLRNPPTICKLEDLYPLWFSAGGGEYHFKSARTGNNMIFRPILIAKSMSTNNDGFLPTGHKSRDARNDNRFPEHRSAQIISDRAIRAEPHLFQVKLFHSRLIGRDRRTFNPDGILLNGSGGLQGDLIVGLVTVGEAEIIVLEIDVEVRVDELFFDELPYNTSHFISIEFDNWVYDLDSP